MAGPVRGPAVRSGGRPMNEAKLSHPTPDQLAAFGLGRLGAAEMAEVERHVAGCDTCGGTLASLADDTLVSLLREPAPVPDSSPEGRKDPGPAPNGPALSPAASGQQAPADATAAYTPGAGAPGAAAHPAESSGTLHVPAPLLDHPRYRVLDLLGAGGMGSVYKAEHLLMGRT